MIARILIISISLWLSKASFGQTFHQAYGKFGLDAGYSIINTSDNGYVITGEYDVSVFNAQVYLVKIDSTGSLLWSKTYGGDTEVHGSGNRGYKVIETQDGGFMISGDVRTFGAGQSDMYLIKTDANGDLIWSRSIGGTLDDHCYSILETPDSCFILAGTTETYTTGNRNVYLVKVSSTGDTLWTKAHGLFVEGAFEIKETTDGYIIAGYTFSTSSGNADILLMKVSSNGDLSWQKSYGGFKHEWGYAIVITPDGGFAVAGSTETYGAGNQDAWLIKTDSLGNLEWARSYGGPDNEEGYSLVQMNDLGFLIAGHTRSFGAGQQDAYVIRTDYQGNIKWSKTFGGEFNEIAEDVIKGLKDSFVIAGSTNSFGMGSSDLYVLKLDSLGESECNYQIAPTVRSNDTTSVNVLSFQTKRGAIVYAPQTNTGTTATSQSEACETPTSINEITTGFAAYPSPANTYLHIEQSSGSNADLIIYNLTGKVIYRDHVEPRSKTTIDISKYPKGIYYLRLVLSDKELTKKVLFVN